MGLLQEVFPVLLPVFPAKILPQSCQSFFGKFFVRLIRSYKKTSIVELPFPAAVAGPVGCGKDPTISRLVSVIAHRDILTTVSPGIFYETSAEVVPSSFFASFLL